MKTVTVNGQEVEWEDRLTVEQLLKKIDSEHRLFLVKVNDTFVKKEQYATKIIPENARVKVIRLLSGG